jgi:hypothetical protein
MGDHVPEQETAEKETTTEVDPAAGSETDEGAKQEGAETEDKPLGPAGEKALHAEKERRKAAEKTARENKARLEALEAELTRLKNGGEDDAAKAVREAREKAEADALTKANARILKAEVKAAAAGKLSDPADALRFLDVSDFEVDADGNVDTDAIKEAVDDLLKSKPYLAAQGGARFKGSADGGARKGSRPSQLTRDDLKGLSPEQIVAAKNEGRLDDLLGVKSK